MIKISIFDQRNIIVKYSMIIADILYTFYDNFWITLTFSPILQLTLWFLVIFPKPLCPQLAPQEFLMIQ